MHALCYLQAMHNRLSELGLAVPLDNEATPISPPSSRQTFTKIRTSTPHVPHSLPQRDSIGTENKDSGEYVHAVNSLNN